MQLAHSTRLSSSAGTTKRSSNTFRRGLTLRVSRRSVLFVFVAMILVCLWHLRALYASMLLSWQFTYKSTQLRWPADAIRDDTSVTPTPSNQLEDLAHDGYNGTRFCTRFMFSSEEEAAENGFSLDAVVRALSVNDQILKEHGGLVLFVTPGSATLLAQRGLRLKDSIVALDVIDPVRDGHTRRNGNDDFHFMQNLLDIKLGGDGSVGMIAADVVLLRHEVIRGVVHGYSRVAAFASPPAERTLNSINLIRPTMNLDFFVFHPGILAQRGFFRMSRTECNGARQKPLDECLSEWVHDSAARQSPTSPKVWFALMSQQYMCTKDHWVPGCLTFKGTDMPAQLERAMKITVETVGSEQARRFAGPVSDKKLTFVTMYDFEDNDVFNKTLAKERMSCNSRVVHAQGHDYVIFCSQRSCSSVEQLAIPLARRVEVNLDALPCAMEGVAGRKLCRKNKIFLSNELAELDEIVYVDVDATILRSQFVGALNAWRNIAPWVAVRAGLQEMDAELRNNFPWSRATTYNSGVAYVRMSFFSNQPDFRQWIGHECRASESSGGQRCLSQYMNRKRRVSVVSPDALLAPEYHCRALDVSNSKLLTKTCFLWHRWGPIPAEYGKCPAS